jgi:hypothetical protein
MGPDRKGSVTEEHMVPLERLSLNGSDMAKLGKNRKGHAKNGRIHIAQKKIYLRCLNTNPDRLC